MKERALKCTNPEISFFHIDEHSKFEIPNQMKKTEYLFILGWTFFFYPGIVLCLLVIHIFFWFSQSLSIGCDFDSISCAFLSVDVFLCHFRPRFYDVDEWQDETKTLFQCFSFSWDFILPFLFSIFQNENVQTALCQTRIIYEQIDAESYIVWPQRHIDALLKIYALK